jgi:hypothetical protein
MGYKKIPAETVEPGEGDCMRCFCTVATWSHLRMARILAASLRQAGNLEILHVLIPDAEKNELPPDEEGITYHGLDEVRSGFPELMPYYFDEFEVCNALKPFLISLLLEKGSDSVIYLDSDIFAVGSFETVWSTLVDHAIVLTPHVLKAPALDLRFINEVSLIDQGIYNGGFSGWSNKPAVFEAIRWMKQRLPVYGFCRRPCGMFVDQKLIPFLPEYFPDNVMINRNPCLNIAFWNIHERNVSFDGKSFRCNKSPVIFFHMSGYRRTHPDQVCCYFSRQLNEVMHKLAPWFRMVLQKYTTVFDTVPQSTKGDYRFRYYQGIRLNPDLRWRLYQKKTLSPLEFGVIRSVIVYFLKRCKRNLKKIIYPKISDGTRND